MPNQLKSKLLDNFFLYKPNRVLYLEVDAALVSLEHVEPEQHVHGLLLQDGEGRGEELVLDLAVNSIARTKSHLCFATG